MIRARMLLFCGLAAASIASLASASGVIPLQLPSGKRLTAELMLTEDEQARGLMFRNKLPRDRALLFVFERAEFHAFWMKNCRFPIDMVWLDAERHVVHLAESVPPCRRDPCPSYQPLRRALYVVEMNAGQARREQVHIGSVLDFTLPQ